MATKKTYTNLAALLEDALPEEDVEVPGVGTIRVRGLSRSEALVIANMAQGDVPIQEQEKEWLRRGLVEPSMSYQDIEKWQSKAPSAHISAVTDVIVRLSGATEEVGKEAYKSVSG